MRVRLADPSHKLPFPNTARFFSQESDGEEVDISDSFWAARLRDGSVIEVIEVEAAAASLAIPPTPALK